MMARGEGGEASLVDTLSVMVPRPLTSKARRPDTQQYLPDFRKDWSTEVSVCTKQRQPQHSPAGSPRL